MDNRTELTRKFISVREQTEKLCQSLFTEDYVIQSMSDVSPPKWHLAHTNWFFETFIIAPRVKNYAWYNPLFQFIFNSYYKTIKTGHHPREQRGYLARPTVKEVYLYRHTINEAMQKLLMTTPENEFADLHNLVTLGLNHEQQHQELLLMDIKYNFFTDPSFPAYHQPILTPSQKVIEEKFIPFAGGIYQIGYKNPRDKCELTQFCYDNELPAHDYLIKPFALANRLISNGEYIEFINAGGYSKTELWLEDGWNCVTSRQWQAPLYWQKESDHFTLHGLQPINLAEPVSHLSYYEADAYARWRGCRLPTEFEWEAASDLQSHYGGNFAEEGIYHPQAIQHRTDQPMQMWGDLWEWTASHYSPYPGYKPLTGTLGEYNGKFMNNQMVLRGGSCATPRSHIRNSYRNYFQQDKKWMFSGLRLAKDLT